jgi:integrase
MWEDCGKDAPVGRPIAKLTALELKRRSKTPGAHGDGGGLWLHVASSNASSWIFRFAAPNPYIVMKAGYAVQRPRGTQREMGIGSYPDVSLEEARGIATELRKELALGRDPIAFREQRRAEEALKAASAITFKDAATRLIQSRAAGWKNKKHAAQWTASLETYAFPILGDLPVAGIGVSHVTQVLEPIWPEIPETARRVRGRLETVLDWAVARGYRDGKLPNPARWKGHLEILLAAPTRVRRVRHHPAMHYSQIPAFMAELRAQTSISARALEFTILTWARTGAVIGGRWPEINLVDKVWTVPGDRAGTKLRQDEHRVPLPGRAIEILQNLPRIKGNDHIFPGAGRGKGLSNMAMLELLQGSYPDLTVHGFRSSAKDWAAETTNFPDIVSEMALAHVVGDEVQAAYRRGELLEKRRKLMEAWAQYAFKVNGDVLLPMRRELTA